MRGDVLPVRIAVAWYRAALRLLPASLRRRRGAEMQELFEELSSEAFRESGFAGLITVGAQSASGLVRVAAAQRFRQRPHPSPQRERDSMFRQLQSDVRHALRTASRAPAFTAVSVLTLALGIGASAAIFSIVYAVVIEALPYEESDRLVYIDHKAPRVGFDGGLGSAGGLYWHYAQHAALIEGISYFEQLEVTVTGTGLEPERLPSLKTTASLFTVLGTHPLHGRLLTEEDDAADGPRSALLSHRYWQRRFGGDPAVVGRDLTISGGSFLIVGVLPPEFHFAPVDLYLDVDQDYSESLAGFNGGSVARLAPGVELGALRSELDRQLAQIDRTFEDPRIAEFLRDSGVAAVPMSLKSATVGPVQKVLWILMGTVGLVLLIACANVANLFLVRAEARQREVALRHALGASRARVLRGLLIESLLLSLAGCALGLVIARVALSALIARIPFELPRVEQVAIDLPVLALSITVAIAAGILFGGLPLMRRQGDLSDALRDGSRTSTDGRSRVRLRRVLVVAQIALSLVLLSGAGLMSRSFARLAAVDPGFVAEDVLTFQLSLPRGQYLDSADAVAFHDTLLAQLRGLPGVVDVGGTRDLPLRGRSGGDVMVRESAPPAEGEISPVIWVTRTTPDYFRAMRIPLVGGRFLSQQDQDEAAAVVLLDQAAVDTFFAGDNPVGERVRVGVDESSPWLEVVGVVGTTKRESLSEAPTPMAYISTTTSSFNSARLMAYAVRVDGDPMALAAPVRGLVRAMDARLPIIQMRTMAGIVEAAEAPMAFTMVMLGIAAGVAVLLGSIGVYGVISYIVGQRTAELGIRMALGATGADVRRMLLGQGAMVAGLGLALGLAGTALLARAVESQLYAVDPFDPLTHTAASLLLMGVVLLATWLPARRASRIDPNDALRSD